MSIVRQVAQLAGTPHLDSLPPLPPWLAKGFS